MARERTKQQPSPSAPPTRKGESLARAMEIWQRNAAGPEYATEALKVLNSVGKVSRQKYLEMFLDMEEQWPGRGWVVQMNQLEKFYYQQNLKLSDKLVQALGVSIADIVEKGVL